VLTPYFLAKRLEKRAPPEGTECVVLRGRSASRCMELLGVREDEEHAVAKAMLRKLQNIEPYKGIIGRYWTE
jgi:hypothetical protein